MSYDKKEEILFFDKHFLNKKSQSKKFLVCCFYCSNINRKKIDFVNVKADRALLLIMKLV